MSLWTDAYQRAANDFHRTFNQGRQMVYMPPQGRPVSCPPMEFRPVEPAPVPVAKPHKSPKWYETRASAAFRKKLAKANADAYAREERRTRALASRLNAKETGGVWMTRKQYGALKDLSPDALRSRASAHGWPRRPGAGKRIPLFLVPFDIAKPVEKVEPPAIVSPAPVKPVSWWRRALRWVWG